MTLNWDNGQGLSFAKRVELDPDYMFTIRRTVTNNSDKPVTLYPYGLISRWGAPPTLGYYILHEGPIGVLGDRLEEWNYSEVADEGKVEFAEHRRLARASPTNTGWPPWCRSRICR